MGACRSYCSQGFSTTTRRIHGLGQPIAQGALELHCSFLQLKHHWTTMLRCDRKELRLFAGYMIRKEIKNLSIDRTNTSERFTLLSDLEF